MIVLPFERANRWSVSTNAVALKLSKPDVGSSSTSSDGSVTNSTPIEVRLRSPPEIVLCSSDPIGVCSHFYKPSSFMISSILRLISSGPTISLSLAANSNASRTVKYSNSVSSCIT